MFFKQIQFFLNCFDTQQLLQTNSSATEHCAGTALTATTLLEATETAATLREANRLFAQGSVTDARDKLATARTQVAKRKSTFGNAAPIGRAGELNDDFDSQLAALDEAGTGFATPPPAAAATGPAPLATAS